MLLTGGEDTDILYRWPLTPTYTNTELPPGSVCMLKFQTVPSDSSAWKYDVVKGCAQMLDTWLDKLDHMSSTPIDGQSSSI